MIAIVIVSSRNSIRITINTGNTSIVIFSIIINITIGKGLLSKFSITSLLLLFLLLLWLLLLALSIL